MQNNPKKKYPVKRIDISINMEKTGINIKRSIKESGYAMHEIMEITGVTAEQTIYKWYSGKSIPSLETLIILCKLLDLRITELLVFDGELDLTNDDNSLDKSSIQFGKEDENRILPPLHKFDYTAHAWHKPGNLLAQAYAYKKNPEINRQHFEGARIKRLTAYYNMICSEVA